MRLLESESGHSFRGRLNDSKVLDVDGTSARDLRSDHRPSGRSDTFRQFQSPLQ